MSHEDEYTITLSSGKIVMLISVALIVMVGCFLGGLVYGRASRPPVAAPPSAPAPLATVPPLAPPAGLGQQAKINLPELPIPAQPQQPVLPLPQGPAGPAPSAQAPARAKSAAPAATPPPVTQPAAAPKPAPAPPTATTTQPKATVATAAKPAPVSAKPKPPVPSQVYTICVFSTRSEDAARDYADRLTKAGYKASVIPTKLQSGAVGYRTVIGAFTDRKIGERQLAELKKKAQFRDAFLILK